MNITEFDMEKCFAKYYERYQNLLGKYYPAHGSIGFTERNQTVNFAAAVESIYPEVFIWYEAPLGGSRHLDAVIFIPEASCTLLVEAKRFSKGPKSLKAVANDIARLCDTRNLATVCQGLKGAYAKCRQNTFGVILADIWPTDADENERILVSWVDKSFFQHYQEKCPLPNQSVAETSQWFNYEFAPFSDKSRYCLLALIFRIS